MSCWLSWAGGRREEGDEACGGLMEINADARVIVRAVARQEDVALKKTSGTNRTFVQHEGSPRVFYRVHSMQRSREWGGKGKEHNNSIEISSVVVNKEVDGSYSWLTNKSAC